MGLQWWGIGEWSAAPLDNASLCLKSTDVPNAHHGCTKWVPRVYQMGTTGVPNEYHGCTKCIPLVNKMGTTGVQNGHDGCTKWVLRVYQMGTTGVPNAHNEYHGCTKASPVRCASCCDPLAVASHGHVILSSFTLACSPSGPSRPIAHSRFFMVHSRIL